MCLCNQQLECRVRLVFGSKGDAIDGFVAFGRIGKHGLQRCFLDPAPYGQALHNTHFRSPQFAIGYGHGCGGALQPHWWRWLTDTVIELKGGACGSSFTYLFDAGAGTLETFCSKQQKPGYRCPSAFATANDFAARVGELTANQRD